MPAPILPKIVRRYLYGFFSSFFSFTISGNLCRCTGYRPIIEGLRTFTEEWEQSHIVSNMQNNELTNGKNSCQMGDACCKKKGRSAKRLKSNDTNHELFDKGSTAESEKLFDTKEFAPYDPSQELIFPPKLKVLDTALWIRN